MTLLGHPLQQMTLLGHPQQQMTLLGHPRPKITELSLHNLINESTVDSEILFWLDKEINWKFTTLQYYCGPKFNGYRIMIDNNLGFIIHQEMK